MTDEAKWKRRLERERAARKQAEELLEQKSLELWEANEALKSFSEDLQRTVDVRSVDLAQALEKEMEANKAKSEFVSMISHEMRTPLNAIIGFSEVLTNEDRNANLSKDQSQHYLENILTSSKGLLSLINDILDMAKIEAGKLELETLEFDHAKLIRQLLDTHTIAARNKNLALNVDIDEQVPSMLVGDPNRLAQVINNLMSNAIKFTDQGSVSLSISMDKKLDSGDFILLYAVQDQGIGMNLAVMETLFTPFTQADNSMSRKYGGTGLGLTISRQLCEAMGGKIWVESSEGKGSTFFFKVRYSPAQQEVECPQAAQNKRENRLKGYYLLLVEDDLINQELAKYLIESEGAKLDIASNGFEALDCVSKNQYHLVLMDLQMPVCDGYSATLKIRESFDPQQLAIVAMTANAAIDVKARCLEVGMTDFLTKPFVLEDLLQKIEEHSLKTSIGNDESFAKPKSDTKNMIDANAALTALHGNRHLYCRILMQFQRCCEDGVYALDQKRIEKDEMNSLRLIYTVKRLAGAIGAKNLESLLNDLEAAIQTKCESDIDRLIEEYSSVLASVNAEISGIDLSEI